MTGSDRVAIVVAELEQMILRDGLQPGERLPTERELSTRLQVSRSVVREAIKRLQSLGRVSSLQGSGTRVASPSGEQVAAGYRWLLQHSVLQLEQLAAVRMPLETAIAALAAEHRSFSHLDRLAMAQTKLLGGEPDLEMQVAADVEFHSILADATGNPIFQLILGPIQDLLIESRRRTIRHFSAQLAFDHHQRILEAVRDQRPDAARQAMADHLRTNAEHLARLDALAARPVDSVPSFPG